MRALLLVPLLLAACTDDDPVETRICNRTGFAIERQAGPSGTSLGLLATDECTPYINEPGAYRYTGITFTIGSDRFNAQPVDFVGETPLAPGKWSYEVKILDYANRSVSVNAVEDAP